MIAPTGAEGDRRTPNGRPYGCGGNLAPSLRGLAAKQTGGVWFLRWDNPSVSCADSSPIRGAEEVRRWMGGRVAERSESSNPMIASGNHTDSNNGRPAGSKFIICNL